MSKILVLYTFVILISCSNSSKEKKINNKEITQNTNQLNSKDVINKVTTEQINQNILDTYLDGEFELNKYDKNAIKYHENGIISNLNLCSVGTNNIGGIYKDAQHRKRLTFYDNGKFYMKYEYKNSEQHGEQLINWKNGNVQHIVNYYGGIKQGEEISYFESGKIRNRFNYNEKGERDGEIIRYFNEKGDVNDISIYKNGVELSHIRYYENGQVEFLRKIEDGNEIIKKFSENGDILINTKKNFLPENGPNIKDVEGNIYKTVYLGSQQWMSNDLKTTKYNDGSSIPVVNDFDKWFALSTGAYCVKYKKYEPNNSQYGNLYNWYVVIGSKNVCPQGWHVPSQEDWDRLIEYLGGEKNAGGKLKEEGTNNWMEPNKNASNTSLFSALPGGYFDYGRGFSSFKNLAFYWSSDEFSSKQAHYLELGALSEFATTKLKIDKRDGLSIRCVKD